MKRAKKDRPKAGTFEQSRPGLAPRTYRKIIISHSRQNASPNPDKEVKEMEMTIRAEPKEFAALVVAIQERQDTSKTAVISEREWLIREYERRLALLKGGASPGDVIFQV